MTYAFHDSINNTQKYKDFHKGLIYDILSCVKSDYFVDNKQFPTFQSFCDEFGYDEDFRQSERMYKECLRIAQGLQNVIPEHIVKNFPD